MIIKIFIVKDGIIMTGKKVCKILLVWLCIITLVMPFGTEVLAAALTKDSVSAILESVNLRGYGGLLFLLLSY